MGNRKPPVSLPRAQNASDEAGPVHRARVIQEDSKYARALGMYYWRLTARPGEVYRELEPMLADYRKLRVRVVGGWELSTVDTFVENLLKASHCCDIALPSIPPRHTERAGTLVALAGQHCKRSSISCAARAQILEHPKVGTTTEWQIESASWMLRGLDLSEAPEAKRTLQLRSI